jgi:ABC-type multidrug transport system fused ATPase/permease subunit
LLAKLYATLGFASQTAFLMAVGAAALLALVVANSFSALTFWLLYRFSYLHAHQLAKRLLTAYLLKPYAYFLRENTAALSKNILAEVDRINLGVLVPGLQMLSRGAVAVALVALLIALDPHLALIVAPLAAGAYALVYVFVRRRLNRIGHQSSKESERRFRAALEALSGVKEIKLAGREQVFLDRFSEPSRQLAGHATTGQAISVLPRYGLETIAFGIILIITLYLLATRSRADDIIPILALYAFAGYRLMPALQQIYYGVTSIRVHGAALQLLYSDLRASVDQRLPPQARVLPFAREIALEGIEFSYPESRLPVLRVLDLRVAINTTVAITGGSGAGKSTLVDVLLGLLTPSGGVIRIDGVPLTADNLRAWQRNIGYVPQHIYLTDDSLAANIAFGIPLAQVDRGAVERAARIAQIHDLALSLPEGYDTPIGERGVRLSGGQRQRVGIARALYADPPLLVLDEATSALDGVTENAIMETIRGLAHHKTIVIIAHRLSTVQACDVIHVLDEGKIACSGTYAQLMDTSAAFRALAQTSELA